MTNLEVIAKKMTKNEQAPLFSLVCRYWMETKIDGCNDCPLRYQCDMELMKEDADIEAWLKEDAGSYESLGNVIRLLETKETEIGDWFNGEWVNPNSHVTVAWMPLPEPYQYPLDIRDCDHCKHYVTCDGQTGCEKWECEFERRQ